MGRMDTRPAAPKPYADFPGLGTSFASAFPPGSDRFILQHLARIHSGVTLSQSWEAVVRAVRTDDPSVTMLAARLLSTGSETARELALVSLHETVVEVGYALDQSEDDPKWRGLAADSWSPLSKNDLLLAWCAGAVIDEVGEPMEDDHWETLKRFQRTDRRVSGYGDKDRSGHGWRTYWRGLAILHLTAMTESWEDADVPRARRREAFRFINWAGDGTDARTAVRVARERGTLNSVTLSAVIREQEAVPAVLGDGAL